MALFFYIFLTTISNCLISILPPATPTKRGLETLGGVLVIFYFALWQWSWNAEWFGGMDGCRSPPCVSSNSSDSGDRGGGGDGKATENRLTWL